MYRITAHIYRNCVSITLITVKTMAMWRTVIRSGQVVPAMKAMVPAKAILNKNPVWDRSIARYSFIQLSELECHGDNKNTQASKWEQA